jgi:predicted metal-dependent enzyme (double-stranded beta helix superfamily)
MVVAVDELVAGCVGAVAESNPRGAVREVLARATSNRRLADALGDSAPGLTVLYNAPNLTVLNVVWPPLMSLFPHDHRMWACIGIYGGREDNEFYRRRGDSIVPSGGTELLEGDVQLLGDDVIHAVQNPARSYTGAIHVYGGDFIATPRSQWDAETLGEQPYDLEDVRREFDRAEKRFSAPQG